VITENCGNKNGEHCRFWCMHQCSWEQHCFGLWCHITGWSLNDIL